MQNESIPKWLIGLGVAGVLLVVLMVRYLLLPEEHKLTFAAGQPGGLYHELALVLAKEIEAAQPQIKIEVIKTKGSLDNVEQLQKETAHIALLQNDTKAGAQIRSITAIHSELLHFLFHREAGIRSLRDLTGKKIAVGPKGSGSEQFTREIFHYLGVPIKESTIVHLPLDTATQQLVSGEIDALMFLTGLGNQACTKALQSGQVELAHLVVPPDNGDGSDSKSWARDLAEGFRVHYPYVTAHTIPLLAYPGLSGRPGHPKKPIPTVGVKAVLACHKSLPEELVETITRTIFEHRAVLSQKHSSFSKLDEQKSTLQLQFPVHVGAENYLRRDEPGFLVKYAEAMGFVISTTILLWGFVSGFRKWLLQKRKDRIDIYYQAIDSIMGRLREGEDTIDNLEEELITLQKDALSELVQEKLSADESFVIYLNMANGCQQLLAQKKQAERQGV